MLHTTYDTRCTLYGTRCNARRVMHVVYYRLGTMPCILYTRHDTLYIAVGKLYTLYYIVYRTSYLLYRLPYTLVTYNIY